MIVVVISSIVSPRFLKLDRSGKYYPAGTKVTQAPLPAHLRSAGDVLTDEGVVLNNRKAHPELEQSGFERSHVRIEIRKNVMHGPALPCLHASRRLIITDGHFSGL